MASASELLLRLEDLPGWGWLELSGELPDQEPAGGAGDELLSRCLGPAFPHDRVVDSADSGRFVRPEAAMAYATVLVLDDEAVALGVFERLSGEDFSRCFARAVGADAGGPATSVTAVRSDDGAVVRRATFRAGGRSAHMDLAVVRGGPALELVFFADSPDAFPDDDRTTALGHVAQRLHSVG